ncbi:hypothetical protein ElyMa_005732000 [Elysia marginata]|uniref:Uncharacterized protein n=1 Tax=Elysia marginata TaxID=1093978 RepID=A0AAV4FJB6_9GAST|nr:hypothetical protein ElyMa_005732000 [Elysia marginata]
MLHGSVDRLCGLAVKTLAQRSEEEDHSHSSQGGSPSGQSPDTAGNANAARKPTRKRADDWLTGPASPSAILDFLRSGYGLCPLEQARSAQNLVSYGTFTTATKSGGWM